MIPGLFWGYINCLFVCLLNFLPLFLFFTVFFPYTFFRTYLLPYFFNSCVIYLLLAEWTRSVSRLDVIGGDQTWL